MLGIKGLKSAENSGLIRFLGKFERAYISETSAPGAGTRLGMNGEQQSLLQPGEEVQGSKKRARLFPLSIPLSLSLSLCLSLFSRAFSAPTTSPNDEHDEHDDDDDDDDHDDHDDQEDAGRQAEVAQMRDDENIGSISKFYFGASAERTLLHRSSPRVTRTLLVQRARNFSTRCGSLLHQPLDYPTRRFLSPHEHTG